MHINIQTCTPLHSEAKAEFSLKDFVKEAEVRKVTKSPIKQKNLLKLIGNEGSGSFETEKRSEKQDEVQKIEEAKPIKVKPVRKVTVPEKNTSPFMRVPRGRKTTLLLTIPGRVSKRYGTRPKENRDCDDSPFSDTSEQISDGSSASPLSSLQVSNSGSSLMLPLMTSPETSPIKSQDLMFSDNIVSRSTHVKRTSIIDRKRIDKFEVLLNQYKIQGLVGCGAFGKVFKATDEEGNLVAIKVYNKRVMKSRWIGKGKTALSLIYSEIHIMETAVHPNLITLYEVINKEDHHKIYLVLEFAAGGTLQMKGKIKENIAKKYFIQLVDCLEYLHDTLQVIHRDIKPQNILFDSEDNLKLSDFGSAQYLQYGRDEFTSSAGTYAFMAPELHGGSKIFKGKPTDIWAAGITLYFMIEGCTPFKSRKMMDLANEVKTQPIVIPMHFSEDLRDLLSHMLDKDPDTRITIEGIKKHPWMTKPE